MKLGLKQLERAAAGGSRGALEKTLAMMDDDTLLRTIAQAALEGEERGDGTRLAFFAPAAVQRIGPKVTPGQLEELLCNEDYSATFRSFMLEITLMPTGRTKAA